MRRLRDADAPGPVLRVRRDDGSPRRGSRIGPLDAVKGLHRHVDYHKGVDVLLVHSRRRAIRDIGGRVVEALVDEIVDIERVQLVALPAPLRIARARDIDAPANGGLAAAGLGGCL